MFINRDNYGIEVLDLEEMYLNRDYSFDVNVNWRFEVPVWHSRHSHKDISCHVTNFLPLQKIEQSNVDVAVDVCIKIGIKPSIDEILQMERVPHAWLNEIQTLNDLYKSFRIDDNKSIVDVILELDSKLTTPPTPIALNISTQHDSITNSNLYKTLREGTELSQLKNFHIPKGIYLNEIKSNDANEIVRIAKEGGYESIIAEKNIDIEVPLNNEQYAELIKVASRHGIVVDMFRNNSNNTMAAYKILYKHMYRETEVEEIVERLEKEISEFGNKFFLTMNFSGYYPVEFVEQRSEGLVLRLRECDLEGIMTNIQGSKFIQYERIDEETFLFHNNALKYQTNCIIHARFVAFQDDYASEVYPV